MADQQLLALIAFAAIVLAIAFFISPGGRRNANGHDGSDSGGGSGGFLSGGDCDGGGDGGGD